MTEELVPAEVRAFILECIESGQPLCAGVPSAGRREGAASLSAAPVRVPLDRDHGRPEELPAQALGPRR